MPVVAVKVDDAAQSDGSVFVVEGSKVRALESELQDLDEISADAVRQFRWQLPANIFVQLLAGHPELRKGRISYVSQSIAWISLVIGPILLLLLIQVQFPMLLQHPHQLRQIRHQPLATNAIARSPAGQQGLLHRKDILTPPRPFLADGSPGRWSCRRFRCCRCPTNDRASLDPRRADCRP